MTPFWMKWWIDGIYLFDFNKTFIVLTYKHENEQEELISDLDHVS